MKVMGIDVEPGCKGHNSRCFSMVVVEDDVIVLKKESIPLHKLIRYIWEYRPQVIATDNIYELAEDQKELRTILSFLPPGTRIVQVTINPDGSFEDIVSLAKRYGLSTGHGKPTPLRTAYLAAMLALRGQGARVRFAEDKTHVIVSKSRSLGAGGMSQNRYMRRVKAAILRATKDIRRALDREGIDYDLVFRKSGGGLESAVFIVYAPRKRLEGVVKPHEDSDIRIDIRPVYSQAVGFEVEAKQAPYTPRPYVIVGVDPGIVTGLAVIDLNGNILYLGSARGLDRQTVIDIVRRIGIPVLVATDVKPAPEYVRKLAANLQVAVYEPPESLSVEEKREIVAERLAGGEWSGKIDSHTRDALAAALRAYHAYQSKLRQVDAYIASIGNMYIDPSRVKADVLRGHTIAEALEREIERVIEGSTSGLYLLRRVRRSQERGEKEEKTVQEDRARELVERIEVLEAENRVLREKLRQLEYELEEVRRDYRLYQLEVNSRVEAERKISMLQHELEVLRKRLDALREEKERAEKRAEELREALLLVAQGKALLATRLHTIGYEELRDLDLQPIVVADQVSPGLEKARARGLTSKIQVLLLPREKTRPRLLYGIPVLPREDYLLYEDGDGLLALVRPEVVLDAYTVLVEEEEKKKRREEKRELTVEDVKALFESYRRMRAKQLLGIGPEDWEGGGGGA